MGSHTPAWQISIDGFLQSSPGPDTAVGTNNTDAGLLPDVRIALFWSGLRTDQTGNDVFIDTTVSGQVKITWKASNVAATASANFSVVLFSNGQIRFDYGTGNAGFAPTVGISMGDSQHFNFPAPYDGSANLGNANSLLYTQNAGFVDMGAYEFEGNSADTTKPPTITAVTSPAFIQTNGSGGTTSHDFANHPDISAKPLNVIDAQAATDYTLIESAWAGRSFFGTADDVNHRKLGNADVCTRLDNRHAECRRRAASSGQVSAHRRNRARRGNS